MCFPACENELVKGKAVLGKDRAVTDGNVITSRSAGTALDFAFEIISELLGEKEAKRIAEEIVYR